MTGELYSIPAADDQGAVRSLLLNALSRLLTAASVPYPSTWSKGNCNHDWFKTCLDREIATKLRSSISMLDRLSRDLRLGRLSLQVQGTKAIKWGLLERRAVRAHVLLFLGTGPKLGGFRKICADGRAATWREETITAARLSGASLRSRRCI
jgi:hypothetical protein